MEQPKACKAVRTTRPVGIGVSTRDAASKGYNPGGASKGRSGWSRKGADKERRDTSGDTTVPPILRMGVRRTRAPPEDGERNSCVGAPSALTCAVSDVASALAEGVWPRCWAPCLT